MDNQYPPTPDQPQKDYARDSGEFASPYDPYPEPLKHSGPGIASFVIALVSVAGYIVGFIVAGSVLASAIEMYGPDLTPDSSQAFLLLGIIMLALLALNVVGTVVGIIGLVLRNRRKVFAIIGVILNALILLLFMVLISAALAQVGAA